MPINQCLTVCLLVLLLFTMEPPSSLLANGDMQYARIYHSATLLQDGKVIAVGGTEKPAVELFDPNTNKWQVVTSMHHPRSGHTATLLLDGRLLVVGGISEGRPTFSSEIYDPATNRWTITTNMTHARTGHTATLMNNGQVLVAGGSDDLLPAEIYEPLTNSWRATGNMIYPRLEHTATLLDDGRVLIVGGGRSEGAPYGGIAEVEIFNPLTANWEEVAGLSYGRRFHTANKLSDGTIVIIGGTYDAAIGVPFEVYNPETDTWRITGPTQILAKHSSTVLPDGSILVCGGSSTIYGVFDNKAESVLLTSARQELTPLPQLNTPRRNHTETLLKDGTVLLVGGMAGGSTVAVSSYERYDPRPFLSNNELFLPLLWS
jgi:N-acetylneuraminic acid mutarotase